MRSKRVIETVETHCGGASGRVVVNGYLEAPGSTMLERLEFCASNLSELRQMLLHEPRGYPGMCCYLLVPPCSPAADVGFLCLEPSGCTPMAGSGAISVVTALLETGMWPVAVPETSLALDTPAGVVHATARIEAGRVVAVTLDMMPSFVIASRRPLLVPSIGEVTVDVAYGGQFYVLARAESLGVPLDLPHSRELARQGVRILAAARSQIPVVHPERPQLNEITWTLLCGDLNEDRVALNCVVGISGEGDPQRPESWIGIIDRSPCGTGTMARMALMADEGKLAIGEQLVHTSILGPSFIGELTGMTHVADRPAVTGSVTGRAWVTGFNTILLDPRDPFPAGYVLGDMWSIDQSRNHVSH